MALGSHLTFVSDIFVFCKNSILSLCFQSYLENSFIWRVVLSGELIDPCTSQPAPVRGIQLSFIEHQPGLMLHNAELADAVI